MKTPTNQTLSVMTFDFIRVLEGDVSMTPASPAPAITLAPAK